jgi:HEAT repeats
VRRIAARILGEIGDPQAVVPLVAAIQDYYVRDAAAASLAAYSPPIVMAALKGQNEDVRRVAAEAIAKHYQDIASERAFVAGVRAREAAAEAKAQFMRTPCDIRFHEWRAHGPWGTHLECQRCGVLLELETGVLFAYKKDGSSAKIGEMELKDGKWRPAG